VPKKILPSLDPDVVQARFSWDQGSNVRLITLGAVADLIRPHINQLLECRTRRENRHFKTSGCCWQITMEWFRVRFEESSRR